MLTMDGSGDEGTTTQPAPMVDRRGPHRRDGPSVPSRGAHGSRARTDANRFVVDSSTNLVNLRAHPPFVLVVSAFVEPSVWQLWILVPLLPAYTELQRWLGRAAVVITAVLGHVGATLFVSTILAAGVAHGRTQLSVRNATDVGVSYGLVAVLGLLAARVPRRRRFWYVMGLTVGFAVALIGWRGFTDLGHMSAWVIGLGLAVVVHRAGAAPAAVGAAGRGHPGGLTT
jgi:hypothetical protein